MGVSSGRPARDEYRIGDTQIRRRHKPQRAVLLRPGNAAMWHIAMPAPQRHRHGPDRHLQVPLHTAAEAQAGRLAMITRRAS